MKSLVAIVLLMMPLIAFAQKQGLGIRIGNPLGLSYKRYLPNHLAFEVSLGTVPDEWNKKYYKNSFSDLDEYNSYSYHSHDVQSTLYLQARYLFHYDISGNKMLGKLDWYWGAGGLFKFARVEYFYFYPYELGPGGSSVLFADGQSDIDIGPEAITGIEYTLNHTPLTLFGEVSGFLEVADRPFSFWVFGAVGMRYNF
jgi:hypothetical protein